MSTPTHADALAGKKFFPCDRSFQFATPREEARDQREHEYSGEELAGPSRPPFQIANQIANPIATHEQPIGHGNGEAGSRRRFTEKSAERSAALVSPVCLVSGP